jgi:hypothetical protein
MHPSHQMRRFQLSLRSCIPVKVLQRDYILRYCDYRWAISVIDFHIPASSVLHLYLSAIGSNSTLHSLWVAPSLRVAVTLDRRVNRIG